MNKAVKYLVDHGFNDLVLNASDGTKPEDFLYASDIMIEFVRRETIDYPTHAALNKAIENHEKEHHRDPIAIQEIRKRNLEMSEMVERMAMGVAAERRSGNKGRRDNVADRRAIK